MPRNKHNSKPKNNKSKEVDDEEVKFKDSRGRDKARGTYKNDAEWYLPDPTIRKQIASFTFNSTIGLPDRYGTEASGGGDISGGSVVANVLEIGHFTNIGLDYTSTGTSNPRLAINTAGLKLYNKYSAINGKTTKYLPEDISASIIAVGEIVSAISHYQRAYSVAFGFQPRNRTLPRALLKAMGFDPDNFMTNLANSRLRMNALISRASNIRVPDDIKYFTKCWDIYANVFYDKGSAMGQYFISRPLGFLKYVETYVDPNTLAEFEFVPLSVNISVDNYLDMVEDLIERVLTSSLFNYVFTDVVRNCQMNGGGVIGFNWITELSNIVPIFSETYMNQIHNMSWGFFDLSNYKISDDVNNLALVSNLYPAFSESKQDLAKAAGGDKLLDFPYTDNPTPEDVIDAVQFMTIADYYTTGGLIPGEYNVRALGDHPVNEVYVHNVGTDSSGSVFEARYSVPYSFSGASYDSTLHRMITLDVQPIRWLYLSASLPKVPYGQLNFWTNIKAQQLYRIFEQSLLGLFDAEFKESLKPVK